MTCLFSNTGIANLRRFLASLLVAGFAAIAGPSGALADDDCTASNAVEFGYQIAHGHAFIKHHAEFVKGTVIAGLAFPDETIENADAFATFVTGIITAPSNEKALMNKRHAFWDARTGTIVITNLIPDDCGTAFRPSAGKTYYDIQK